MEALKIETNKRENQILYNIKSHLKNWKWPQLSTKQIIIIIICSIIFVIVSATLLGESFQYIEWDEVGLKKNTASNDVDYSKVYGSGRYFWGINYEVVPFKRTIEIVNFDDEDGGEGSLIIFTDTGLEIKILCSFQYQIIQDRLATMFINFGNTYHQQVVSMARSILKNTAPMFLVEQYYQARTLISNTFFDALNRGFKDINMVNLIDFQLRHIYLAEEINQKLLKIQVQLQINLREQYVQASTIIRKQTETQVAAIKSNATRILAQADSQATLIRSRAQANAFKARETARKEGRALLFQALNFTTSQQKLAYMYATGLSSSGARLLVDAKNTLVSVDGDKK